MTRGQLPQRAGLPGLNGGGAAAALPSREGKGGEGAEAWEGEGDRDGKGGPGKDEKKKDMTNQIMGEEKKGSVRNGTWKQFTATVH